MTCNFRNPYTKKLYSEVTKLVPVRFVEDNSMSVYGEMNFDENLQTVQIRYKRNPDEIVTIAHELLHVRMEFQDHFPLLAWPTKQPDITPGVEDLVKRIRYAVDDTYILHRLYKNTGELPISQVFYREIRKDLKRRIVHVVKDLPIESRSIVTAWRLRLADMSLSEFDSILTSDQRNLSKNFISEFKKKDAEAENLFNHLKKNVAGSMLSDAKDMGKALIDLHDKLSLPSWVHLATRQKINGRWLLKP